MLLWFAERHIVLFFFFFNDTATTEIYTLSLHDALPISAADASMLTAVFAAATMSLLRHDRQRDVGLRRASPASKPTDRKSTRLNSSHANISYAVFCLKKKNNCYIQPNISLPRQSVRYRR